MLLGVPREIKNNEFRVGLTPASVGELVSRGHSVLVERACGEAIGFADQVYAEAGAELVECAEEVYRRAQLLIKVKEPQPQECRWLRESQLLFTFLHLASSSSLVQRLQSSGVSAIAYETVTAGAGNLPLLMPMSEIAGRMAVQAGAHHLELAQGGAGLLLGGVAGVAPARVTILGAGVVGANAAAVAVGMGAEVVVLDRELAPLRHLQARYAGRVSTLHATRGSIAVEVARADLLVAAVLLPGAATPRLINREHLRSMRAGSVLVDVSIDQGGCAETSRPTTHQQPTFVVDGVVHYCVANIPGTVARTASQALNSATLPYVVALADGGGLPVLRRRADLRDGLNVHRGQVVHGAVAEAHDLPCSDPVALLAE